MFSVVYLPLRHFIPGRLIPGRFIHRRLIPGRLIPVRRRPGIRRRCFILRRLILRLFRTSLCVEKSKTSKLKLGCHYKNATKMEQHRNVQLWRHLVVIQCTSSKICFKNVKISVNVVLLTSNSHQVSKTTQITHTYALLCNECTKINKLCFS